MSLGCIFSFIPTIYSFPGNKQTSNLEGHHLIYESGWEAWVTRLPSGFLYQNDMYGIVEKYYMYRNGTMSNVTDDSLCANDS